MAAKTATKTKSTARSKTAAKAKVKAPVKAKAAAGSKAVKRAPAKKAAAPKKPVAKKAAAVKKPVAKKTAAAKKPAAKKTAAAKKPVAKKTAAAKKPAPVKKAPVAAAPQKNPQQRHGFRVKEFIVYPAHGVGQILDIEMQEVAGMSLELYVISFENEKMTLRVPTIKWESVGMRKLSDGVVAAKALKTLKGKARVKRTMWSRRAQEYEAKINSGDLVSVAEVVRDLYRSETQPEQSYSERQLYEAALERMAREIAAVEKIDDQGAVQKITRILFKSVEKLRQSEIEADMGDATEEEAA